MHTTSYDGDIHFLHNGDYSGDVEIVVPATTAGVEIRHHDHTVSIKIPYKALEYLVADKVSNEFIDKLEDVMSMDDLFKALLPVWKLYPPDLLHFVRKIASLDIDIEARRKVSLQDLVDEAKKILES
jgi:hypothetical protein